MRRYCKFILVLAILLILLPMTALSQIAYDSKQKLLSVKSEGGLLSALLSEVSAKTGIEVYYNPSFDKKVFVNIKNQPVDEVIKAMIKPLNNAFIYEGKSIKAVKIFQKTESEASTKIKPSMSQSIATSPSAAKDLSRKEAPTRKELESSARERRRKQAESQGTLKEFEEKEAQRDKSRKSREMKREERRQEREKMKMEREEKRKKMETEGKTTPRTKPQ